MIDQKPNLEEMEEKPLNEDVKINKHLSFQEKLLDLKDNITVEPLLGGLIISSVLSMFAMMNLNLDKACRVNLGYSDEVCDALVKRQGNHTHEEKEVQKLISSIGMWASVLKTLIPSIIIMFLGAWSDRTGKRKLCILLPVLGELLTSISNLINVYFFYEIPVEITVFMESIFVSITGGWVTMFLGVFSYISDITSEESRTFRVGLVNFCMTVGFPIGIGLSGLLLKNIGYYGVFFTTLSMFSLVLLCGCICLKEPSTIRKKKGLPPIERPEVKSNVSFFNMSHVADTLTVAFKKRRKNRRMKVLFNLFAVFVLFGPTMSEHGILYLFVRGRLNWDMVKFSIYTIYHIILHTCGAIFAILVFSKKLQMDDSMLCLISITSKFVGGIWTAFVQSDWEMYLVPVVELLNGTTFTSLRSIASKLVEKQEVAKMNSLFSLTETAANLLFNPFYMWMYMRTVDVMSGAVFLLSAALIVPAWAVLVTFYIQHRRELSKVRKKALETENEEDEEMKKAESVLLIDGKNIMSKFGDFNNKEKEDNLVIANKENKGQLHKDEKELTNIK